MNIVQAKTLLADTNASAGTFFDYKPDASVKDALKVVYGSKVRIGTIKKDYPNLEQYVRDNFVAIKMGTYSFVADKSQTVHHENLMQTDHTTPMANIASQSHVESDIVSYVPIKDKNYVPHGCFSLMRKVAASRSFCPVYVTGDSGNGKTSGIAQACSRENRELIHINLTCETGEEDLIGTFTLVNGDLKWVDGPVLTAMRRGAVLLLDEIDAADTGRVMCLQSIINGDPIYVKKTNEMLVAAPGFTVVATGNTKGTGEGTDRFVGTQILNDAFLERFNMMIEQDYPDGRTEDKILKHYIDDEAFRKRLVAFAATTRKAFKDGGSDHCITTRRLVQIAKNYSIVKNEIQSVTLAVSRFDSDTRDSFVLLYKTLSKGGADDAPVDNQTEDDDSPF